MALQVLTDSTEFTINKFTEHINNSDIHITPQEREFWNNKVRCYLDTLEQDNIIFTIH